MTTPTFASAKDVLTALSSQGFQSNVETIKLISRTCRDIFTENLSLCITGADQSGEAKKVIGNLLCAISPATINKVRKIIPDVEPAAVIPVVLNSPAKFLSAVDVANNPQHERHQDAKAFIIATLTRTNAGMDAAPQQAISEPVSRQQDQPPPVRSNQPAPAREPAKAASSDRKYHSCHVYGSSYALCFNASEKDGRHGVMVDAAVSDGPKSYDWNNAIHIWLDTNEVSAVLAVFRRWRRGVEFSAHGAQNDKSFSIEFQGKHFFAKVSAKKINSHPARAVKIMPTDATEVSILFLTQLAQNYPAIPISELLATVKASHLSCDDAAAA